MIKIVLANGLSLSNSRMDCDKSGKILSGILLVFFNLKSIAKDLEIKTDLP